MAEAFYTYSPDMLDVHACNTSVLALYSEASRKFLATFVNAWRVRLEQALKIFRMEDGSIEDDRQLDLSSF